MIMLYTGFVGSGKSYHATVEGIRIAESLSNKYVIANFPIRKREIKINKTINKIIKTKLPIEKKLRWIYKDNEELTVDYLIQESLKNGWNKKESSCTVIFDEASIPFNSRTWNKNDRLEWIKFLSQSRKYGYDFIFITQDARMLDKQIRSLCEYEVVHKKLNNYGLLKFLPVTIFACVTYWNGINPRYAKGRLKLIRYKRSIAERYDTLRLFDVDMVQV